MSDNPNQIDGGLGGLDDSDFGSGGTIDDSVTDSDPGGGGGGAGGDDDDDDLGTGPGGGGATDGPTGGAGGSTGGSDDDDDDNPNRVDLDDAEFGDDGVIDDDSGTGRDDSSGSNRDQSSEDSQTGPGGTGGTDSTSPGRVDGGAVDGDPNTGSGGSTTTPDSGTDSPGRVDSGAVDGDPNTGTGETGSSGTEPSGSDSTDGIASDVAEDAERAQPGEQVPGDQSGDSDGSQQSDSNGGSDRSVRDRVRDRASDAVDRARDAVGGVVGAGGAEEAADAVTEDQDDGPPEEFGRAGRVEGGLDGLRFDDEGEAILEETPDRQGLETEGGPDGIAASEAQREFTRETGLDDEDVFVAENVDGDPVALPTEGFEQDVEEQAAAGSPVSAGGIEADVDQDFSAETALNEAGVEQVIEQQASAQQQQIADQSQFGAGDLESEVTVRDGSVQVDTDVRDAVLRDLEADRAQGRAQARQDQEFNAGLDRGPDGGVATPLLDSAEADRRSERSLEDATDQPGGIEQAQRFLRDGEVTVGVDLDPNRGGFANQYTSADTGGQSTSVTVPVGVDSITEAVESESEVGAFAEQYTDEDLDQTDFSNREIISLDVDPNRGGFASQFTDEPVGQDGSEVTVDQQFARDFATNTAEGLVTTPTTAAQSLAGAGIAAGETAEFVVEGEDDQLSGEDFGQATGFQEGAFASQFTDEDVIPGADESGRAEEVSRGVVEGTVETAEFFSENPSEVGTVASGFVFAGPAAVGTGAALRRTAQVTRDRVRTAGGEYISPEDLTQQSVLEDGGDTFPGIREEYRDTFDRDEAEAIRQQAADSTPEEIQEQFDEAGVESGADLVKALDVEPEGPRSGRGAQGFETPDADTEAAAAYETQGTSLGPDLSTYFLGTSERSRVSLTPGIPDPGGSPTAVIARTDVEESRATSTREFDQELQDLEGETTTRTVSPEFEDFNPVEEAEVQAPPGAQFTDVGAATGGPVRNLARRAGIGSDFYTEVSGRRVPLRTVADPDDVDVSGGGALRAFREDDRGQLGGSRDGGGSFATQSLEELSERGRRPVDRPAPVSPGPPLGRVADDFDRDRGRRDRAEDRGSPFRPDRDQPATSPTSPFGESTSTGPFSGGGAGPFTGGSGGPGGFDVTGGSGGPFDGGGSGNTVRGGGIGPDDGTTPGGGPTPGPDPTDDPFTPGIPFDRTRLDDEERPEDRQQSVETSPTGFGPVGFNNPVDSPGEVLFGSPGSFDRRGPRQVAQR